MKIWSWTVEPNGHSHTKSEIKTGGSTTVENLVKEGWGERFRDRLIGRDSQRRVNKVNCWEGMTMDDTRLTSLFVTSLITYFISRTGIQ